MVIYVSNGHNSDDVKIKIVHKLSDEKLLDSCEVYGIKLLQTIYPLGLNGNVKGYGNISNI